MPGAVTTPRDTDHELLLVMNDRQYRDAAPQIEKLKKATGAKSNTDVLLEALRVASSMVAPDQEDPSP